MPEACGKLGAAPEATARGAAFWQVPALAVGAGWGAVGVSKAWELAAPRGPQTWADQFPAWMLGVVATVEMLACAAIFGGRVRSGIGLGLGLLCAFSLLLAARPPGKTPCGCMGVLESGALGAADPLLRNATLAAMHLLALACVTRGPAARSRRRARA